MKDVKLFGLIIVGMVLLFGPAIQASSDIEIRLNVLEKRIESLETKIESLLDFVFVFIESQPPVTNVKAKSEAEQSDSGIPELEPFLFDNVTLSSRLSGIVDLKGEVLNQSGVTYSSLVFFQVTLYNSDDGVIGSKAFSLLGFKDGQTKSFDVTVFGVDLDDIYEWKVEFDKGF